MNFKLRIAGRSDSDYAANTDDRRSVSGSRVFIEGAPACFQSVTQKFVTLSVTESESGAGVSTTQDMMYCYRIITSLGLKVELPGYYGQQLQCWRTMLNSFSLEN